MNDLNERVAREVMGWEWDATTKMWVAPNGKTFFRTALNGYEGMGLVIERMRELLKPFDFACSTVEDCGDLFVASFWVDEKGGWISGKRADTLPEAVALAALEAVRHE